MVRGIEDRPARARLAADARTCLLFTMCHNRRSAPVHRVARRNLSCLHVNGCSSPAAQRTNIAQHRKDGGASRDRTDDPLLAKQVLSQLSYGPERGMVGRGGLEPPTSRLSVVRSNHLSYQPQRGARTEPFTKKEKRRRQFRRNRLTRPALFQ
jgi:hypothetical protein